jgi:hypothetical protein
MVRVERMLRPEVVRIKHTVANDATGDAALYLRVLLSDEASKPERLREVTTRISAVIRQRLEPLNSWGLIFYLRFRSQSEQAALQDPAWT